MTDPVIAKRHAVDIDRALYRARCCLIRARVQGYRLDCLSRAVVALEGALANAEAEVDTADERL